MTNPGVASALRDLAVGCGTRKTIDGDTLDLYLRNLDDLPDGLVAQACRELIRTQTFFPSIAEIRQRVLAISPAGGALVDPEAVWAEVMQQADRIGPEGVVRELRGGEWIEHRPEFSSPLIAEAVRRIGWRSLCRISLDDEPTVRAQFRRALESVQRQAVDPILSGRTQVGSVLPEGRPDVMRELTAMWSRGEGERNTYDINEL